MTVLNALKQTTGTKVHQPNWIFQQMIQQVLQAVLQDKEEEHTSQKDTAKTFL